MLHIVPQSGRRLRL